MLREVNLILSVSGERSTNTREFSETISLLTRDFLWNHECLEMDFLGLWWQLQGRGKVDSFLAYTYLCF